MYAMTLGDSNEPLHCRFNCNKCTHVALIIEGHYTWMGGGSAWEPFLLSTQFSREPNNALNVNYILKTQPYTFYLEERSHKCEGNSAGPPES